MAKKPKKLTRKQKDIVDQLLDNQLYHGKVVRARACISDLYEMLPDRTKDIADVKECLAAIEELSSKYYLRCILLENKLGLH